MNKQLLPISGIASADLEARFHRKSVKVLSIARDQRSHRGLILLDSSGSMRSHWTDAIRFAKLFASQNAGTMQLALMTFNGKTSSALGFSKGEATVIEKLQELATPAYETKDVRGMTALRDAIIQAAQLFDHPTSADAIYLITDGTDDASKRDTKSVDHLLSSTSVRLFVTILGREQYLTPEENLGSEELQEMTADSGGGMLGYLDWSDSKLFLESDARYSVGWPPGQALARLFQAVSRDDIIQVQLPEPVRKFDHFHLKFSRKGRKRWKSVRIAFPQLLPPCSGRQLRSKPTPPEVGAAQVPKRGSHE